MDKKNILYGMISGNGKFKFEDFISEMQGFCLGLRLTHWETTSFELHKAVEMTQATLEGLLDDFVEAFTGMDGKRSTFKKDICAST
ncbi:MAG: hypothetical protein WC450_10850, partial [Candidatus Omnitrophota bacterium]